MEIWRRSAAIAGATATVEETVAGSKDWSTVPEWAVARICALERRNRDLSHRLAAAQALARHDDVSGLPNHRAAEELLRRILARHTRTNAPFAVLFVDGDNLKRYNEQGYDAGNRMIARLAETLQAHLRPGDYVARWLSGDEFLVALPGAGAAAAQTVGERLRGAVQAAFADAALPVTISIGLAVFPRDGTDLHALIDRATTSNALAKRTGKNRVVPWTAAAADSLTRGSVDSGTRAGPL